jgi:hypothetical protein
MPLGENMTSETSPAPLAHGDAIVLDYLAALWAESESLSPDLRDELMSTVSDYIALRRSGTEPHQVVGRLGRMPAHLRRPVAMEPAAGPVNPSEYTAVALLTVGAVAVPVVSPLAGLLIATGSPRWTTAQKAAAWVLSCGSVASSMLFLLFTAGVQDRAIPLVLTFFALVAGPVLAGLSLLPALSRRRR